MASVVSVGSACSTLAALLWFYHALIWQQPTDCRVCWPLIAHIHYRRRDRESDALWLLADGARDRHTLEQVIYDARLQQDRWLRHAAWSQQLEVAAEMYTRRNSGRFPPPEFPEWLKFARERNSVIIDFFDQIMDDLLPFWGMEPRAIRQLVRDATKGPSMASVTVRNHIVSRSEVQKEEDAVMLDRLLEMMNKFSEHLPDMTIPINLSRQPRVLARWSERRGLVRAATEYSAFLQSGYFEHPDSFRNTTGEQTDGTTDDAVHELGERMMTAAEFRQMAALTCPPGSAVRSGCGRNVRDLCLRCARSHSTGQFLTDWEKSLDLCHQPDLGHLHDMYAAVPSPAPMLKMVPIFSRYKTSNFADILVPLVDERDEGDEGQQVDMTSFYAKKNTLYWRGVPDRRAAGVRGSQGHRLAHLTNNVTEGEEVALLLPVDPTVLARYRYRRIELQEANRALPFDVGMSAEKSCVGQGGAEEAEDVCPLVLDELGSRPAGAEWHEQRYPLMLDGVEGPPRGLLRALRSEMTPWVGTVFRTWYTERLAEWLHFVPVDVRLHGLHATLEYFTGLVSRAEADGLVAGQVEAAAAVASRREQRGAEDGRWIAAQGRSWARRALRREDMEIYLFRLLLEWGRVVDDARDKLAYWPCFGSGPGCTGKP